MSVALSSVSSSVSSRPSSNHRPTLGSGSVSSGIVPSSGVVPPYPYPTGSGASTASRGSFFPGGYGSLPTGTGSASNGLPRYPYPSGTGYSLSRGGSLPVGTGGYYSAGNGTTANTNSTLYLTQFITETIAPCTINAVGANVYYWDHYRIGITQCGGTLHGSCTNQSTVAPYTLGAPATRTVRGWNAPTPVPIPASISSLTVQISGYTNPIETMTNYYLNGVTYSTVTFVKEYTQVGFCECISTLEHKPG